MAQNAKSLKRRECKPPKKKIQRSHQAMLKLAG